MTSTLPRAPLPFRLTADDFKTSRENGSNSTYKWIDISRKARKEAPRVIRERYTERHQWQKHEVTTQSLENVGSHSTISNVVKGKNVGRRRQKAPGAPVVPTYVPAYVTGVLSTIPRTQTQTPSHAQQVHISRSVSSAPNGAYYSPMDCSQSPSLHSSTLYDPSFPPPYHPSNTNCASEYQGYAIDRVMAMEPKGPYDSFVPKEFIQHPLPGFSQIRSTRFMEPDQAKNKRDAADVQAFFQRASTKDPYADYIPSKYENIEALERALLERAGVVPDKSGKFKKPYEDLPFTAAAFSKYQSGRVANGEDQRQ